ncbi:hypothetical protein [Hymenobacter coccineus]|uniref:DAC domain-containing protein n=1 Tax=Hymenobacter coccineus TaxID=1908235 RepID=A0A1G1TJC5_9BACT|nr:hypothetical protein [Hymenobacter coccineus]OGX90968.1 hypothetical protein BEN49_05670 [Hymenobacter coccineus]
MNQKEFATVVEQYICPVLAGATVVKVVHEPAGAEQITLQGKGQTMRISPTETAAYQVEIKRSQVFNPDDARLAEAVITEIVANYNKTTLPYRTRVIKYAIEVGVCKFLAPASTAMLIDILDGFESWSMRTYEGRRPTFSIVVDFNNKQEVDATHPAIGQVLATDFSALLSNSVESGLVLSASGALVDYVNFSTDAVVDNNFAPWRFVSFSNYADNNRVCFTRTDNSQVLIFKHQKLFFSKMNNSWNYYNHGSTIAALAGGSLEVRKAVYETILDVSFSRTGGCIAVVRLADVARLVVEDGRGVQSVIKRDDLLASPTSLKSQTLSSLIRGRPFQDLDRIARKEMVGIDGATIITYEGEVLAVGAIIKIDGGSTGGGRRAATKTLAAFGTAIKVSADGMVQAFVRGDEEQPESVSEF